MTTLPALKKATEVALPRELMEKAQDYANKSRSRRTLEEYAKLWRKFDGWCVKNGRDSMPSSVQTLAAYVTWMASGQDQGKSISTGYIHAAISAIKFEHRSAGYAVDADHPQFQAVWGGIRREIAKKRTTKRVAPLLFKDLEEIIGMLRPDLPREAQDAAILAIASGGALRRSEVAGLDWQRIGTGDDEERTGYLEITEDAARIVLMTSKASQDAAVTIVIPRKECPTIIETIETWIRVGNVKPGMPVFRAVKGRGWSANPQSPYKGVSWNARTEKWRAQAMVAGKNKPVGEFEDDYDAHVAYCKARGVKPKTRAEAAKVEFSERGRIQPGFVAAVVKRRVKQLLEQRSKQKGRKKPTAAEILEVTSKFSGHSMRAGYATSAAQNDVPYHRMKGHTRHKSDQMLNIYIREVDTMKNSGLKGVGF
jgi:integrase